MRTLILLSLLWSCHRTSVTGVVEARGPLFGDWSLAPTNCVSGGFGFFGAELWDSADPSTALRVRANEVGGPTITVYRAPDEELRIRSERCQVFTVDLVSAAPRPYFRGLPISGALDLGCDEGAEGAIAGVLDFENCVVGAREQP